MIGTARFYNAVPETGRQFTMLDHYRVLYLIFVGRVEWNFTYLVVSLSKLNHIANREFHTLEEG